MKASKNAAISGARNLRIPSDMMTDNLSTTASRRPATRVAVLSADGFEQSELLEPVEALQTAGMQAHIISPSGNPIRGWSENDWGQTIAADLALDDATPSDFDALLLPGGVLNSDSLRNEEQAWAFAEHFFDENKPVFAICHGAQVLIDAGLVKGRRMTSYQAIATDLINAGAKWVDSEVVKDGVFVTSRSPEDLPAFCEVMLETLGRSSTPLSTEEISQKPDTKHPL